MQKYFAFHNGVNVGPFTFNEIERKFKASELFPTDFVFAPERGDWLPILEFIMVFGPKFPVLTLQTDGASAPQDPHVDFERFVAGMPPAPEYLKKELMWTDAGEHDKRAQLAQFTRPRAAGHKPTVPPPELASSAPDLPPPLTGKPRFKAPASLPAPQVASTPANAPSAMARFDRRFESNLDLSAKLKLQVRSPKATRLVFDPLPPVQAGQAFTVVIRAVDDHGNVDTNFHEAIELASHSPMEGLGPLQFKAGIAQCTLVSQTTGYLEVYLRIPGAFENGEADFNIVHH